MLVRGEKNNLLDSISKLSTSKVCFCIIAIIFWCLVLVLNIYYPLCLDDFDYSFVFREFPIRKIESISDIFRSQYNHYYIWGGRSVVHFIAQFLLYIGNPLADVLNSLIYILFAYLIYCICNKERPRNIFLFVVINLCIWFLYPDFLGSIIWLTGSANYLWGMLLVLLFIYPYYCYYLDSKPYNNVIRFVSLFFLGIIAGWTNENTALAMIIIVVFFILYWCFKKEKIPAWAISGLVGACIGYFFMIAAPGNYERMTQALITSNQYSKSLIRLLPYRTYSIVIRFWQILFMIYGVYGMLVCVYRKHNQNKVNSKILLISFVFFIASNIAVWSMIVSPIFPSRALFGPVSYFIMASGILFANIKHSSKSGKKIGYLLLIGCFSFIYSYTLKLRGVYLLHTLMQERVEFINREKARGVKDIVITKKISIPLVFSVYADITEDPEMWPNTSYETYFDLNSIVYKANTDK